jgi:hypothetical protein
VGVERPTDTQGRNILTTTLGELVGWGRANQVRAADLLAIIGRPPPKYGAATSPPGQD